jgi:nitrate reductase NapE component
MWRAPERRVRDRASATRRSFLVLLLVLAIGLFPPLSVSAGSWVVVSAYRVGTVTGSVCPSAEYGAFFPGQYGHDQHCVGPGGDAATCGSNHGCISQWNWTNYGGAQRNVLLLPKTWLYTIPCLAQRSGAWTAANYRATMWIR